MSKHSARLPSLLARGAFVAALLLASSAAGQTATVPLRLTLELGESALDRARVRDAIAQELGAAIEEGPAPVTGRSLLVVVDAANRKARLVYREPVSASAGAGGTNEAAPPTAAGPDRAIERVLDLPEDPNHATAAIALLAGNLARDQTSDLMALMRAHPRTDGPAAAPSGAGRPPGGARPVTWVERACESGIVVSAWPPHAVFPKGCARERLRIDFPYGRAQHIVGVQTGLVDDAVRVEGGQISLFFGRSSEALDGIQASAMVAFSEGELKGAQIGGIVNVSLGHLAGGQVATIANVANELDGAQVGLANVSGVAGTQVGLADVSGVVGTQVGLANVSGVAGTQVGLVNVAHDAAVQVGVINVAADPNTETIGLVNLGRLRAVGWGTTDRFVHVGLEMGGAHVYSLVTGGRRWGSTTAYDAGAGLGARMEPDAPGWFGQVDAGMHVEATSTANQSWTVAGVAQYRLAFGYDFAKHFGIFIGGAVRHGFVRGRSLGVEALAGVAF